MTEELKPGNYIGLYIDNDLIYTGILKDFGTMQSGRKIYQVLLVKNIFQRNFPGNSLRHRYKTCDMGTSARRNKTT